VRRKIFNALAAASLLTCLLMLGLWVRSYSTSEEILFDHMAGAGTARWSVHSTSGQLHLIHAVISEGQPLSFGWHYARAASPLSSSAKRPWNGFHAVFNITIRNRSPIWIWDIVVVPQWFIAALFAIAPSIWLIRRLRATSHPPPGLCKSCNYDLTGNTSGTCPECGMRIGSDSLMAAN
jgi:hypothetical protein